MDGLNGGCSHGHSGLHWSIVALVGRGAGRHSGGSHCVLTKTFYCCIMDAFSMIHLIPIIFRTASVTAGAGGGSPSASAIIILSESRGRQRLTHRSHPLRDSHSDRQIQKGFSPPFSPPEFEASRCYPARDGGSCPGRSLRERRAPTPSTHRIFYQSRPFREGKRGGEREDGSGSCSVRESTLHGPCKGLLSDAAEAGEACSTAHACGGRHALRAR